MASLKSIQNDKKLIVGMCHFNPLPGEPLYDKEQGLCAIIESISKDIKALQDGGANALLFANEFGYPHTSSVQGVTIATMSCVIGAVSHLIKVPFGVDCMFDPLGTVDLALATEADFVRVIIEPCPVAGSDFRSSALGNMTRRIIQNGAVNEISLLVNATHALNEANKNKDVETFLNLFDEQAHANALCVSSKLVLDLGDRIKNSLPNDMLLMAEGGCNSSNIADIMQIADGCVVGSSLKINGQIRNNVDVTRVRKFFISAMGK